MFRENQVSGNRLVILNQPHNSRYYYPIYRESDWNEGQGGGFILPLIAGGITGAIIAGTLNNKQQAYGMQGYPVQTYPMPVPYYPSMPMNYQGVSSQTQPMIQTNVPQYPMMPSIENMPEDIMIQKQGKAYVTNPLMPNQQLTHLMPYYMFPIRY